MRRWFVLACVIGGCWRGEPPVALAPPPEPAPAEPPPRVAPRGPEPGSFEEAMVKMGEFRDKMCACGSKPCADAVTDEMTKWSVEMAKHSDKSRRDMKPTDDQIKEITAVTEEFTKCMTAAMAPGSTMGNP